MTVIGTFEAFPFGKCWFGLVQDSITIAGTVALSLIHI